MTQTLEDLRDHVRELEQMDRRLQACLTDVRAEHEAATARLAAAAKADLSLRPLTAVQGPPQGYRHGHVSLEQARDAVVRLKHFTIGELAAELGCSHARARKELDRVMSEWKDLVKPDGRLGSRQLWAYVPPEGPGTAFEVQQRLRAAGQEAVAGGAQEDIKQSIIGMIAAKELKEVAREAIADGWELVHGTGKHPLSLVKNGHKPIVLSSTPRNPSGAARAIRRQLRAS